MLKKKIDGNDADSKVIQKNMKIFPGGLFIIGGIYARDNMKGIELMEV